MSTLSYKPEGGRRVNRHERGRGAGQRDRAGGTEKSGWERHRSVGGGIFSVCQSVHCDTERTSVM